MAPSRVISRPARLAAPFDPSVVATLPSASVTESCTLVTSEAQIAIDDVILDGLDVTSIVRSLPLSPVRENRMQ